MLCSCSDKKRNVGWIYFQPLVHAAFVFAGVYCRYANARIISCNMLSERRKGLHRGFDKRTSSICRLLRLVKSGTVHCNVIAACRFGNNSAYNSAHMSHNHKMADYICLVPMFMGLISPAPDYMDVILLLRNVPKGAVVQPAKDGLVWYKQSDNRWFT